ncbi:hypothetical protein [Chryseobacterium indologenes]|uniref:Uncharacterized protein n=1 Tax=Chryseobacterium indologenes TaxID=253 RepID=A0A0N0IW42_CHRID|nr:hypothetical protein [Chryseobacterium indologenes]KPE51012.1 hypothetical protein AOB46_12560 [Chryseobacterium indologenes]
MENTLENKAKFFAQYYSVPCIQNDEWIWRENDEFGKLPSGCDITDCYANLKPLTLITDEDAFRIGFCNRKIFLATNTNLYIYQINSADFLRSKGYALPWMGLSVEKLIEYGWIKLRES